MPEIIIAGIPVDFPFEPYEVQTNYMEKVICCLRDGTNGVLESPTGTGKTLSLLCASLAWLRTRKSELQQNVNQQSVDQQAIVLDDVSRKNTMNWGVPKIIYASRTHSQLTQAMRELKRTAYATMRSVVLGSRDQLCIHPDVMREVGNSNKINMCKLRVQSKTCSFHLRVEMQKDNPDLRGPSIMDIEDLVKVGQHLKMCPYYASKELVQDADITFMPYNYLLDPKTRKANKVELNNTIIILDEAHNIEKICEESASVRIRSSDVAMAIEDISCIMKMFSTKPEDFGGGNSGDEPKDFNLEDLALLKEMLLDLEKAIDAVIVKNKEEGVTYPASYIYDLLAKANFNHHNYGQIVSLLDKLVQYLMVASPNLRKGASLLMLSDLLAIVFANKEDDMPKVHRCFKVHVEVEEAKGQNDFNKDCFSTTVKTTKTSKIINFWCFNPGFGMEQLLNAQIRSIILTSGTLAPLKPFIAELAIPVSQHLENPHIIDSSQVYVKIIGTGPDREQLISNYKNRDNPRYISSLGQTILNVARIVPDGLLVFFPSYPMLSQCVNTWQASGLWADISRHKPVFLEPRGKNEFSVVMEQFYEAIRTSRGACFMAVCRGKVSEGLDFADRNGRAVIITGLPFPPFKDPKVVLKRRYLDTNRTKENQLLNGQEWYKLDATRAVNQAIGRVIRHRNDYGAILLCDARFQEAAQIQQLSKWIRDRLGTKSLSSPFGPVVRELREFFKCAQATSVTALNKQIVHNENPLLVANEVKTESRANKCTQLNEERKVMPKFETPNSTENASIKDYAIAAKSGYQVELSDPNFMCRLNKNVTSINFSTLQNTNDVAIAQKRERTLSPPHFSNTSSVKKRYKLFQKNVDDECTTKNSSLELNSCSKLHSNSELNTNLIQTQQLPEKRIEFLRLVRSAINSEQFLSFGAAVSAYSKESDNKCFDNLMDVLINVLGKPELLYLLRGMRRFLKTDHQVDFDLRLNNLKLCSDSQICK